MRILFAANTPPDPNLGAPGCDLATIAALQRLGHEVRSIWATDMRRRIRHGNLHQLMELPRSFAAAVDARWRSENFDVVQVNQPHAYLAAKNHRRRQRGGVFVNRSHGWEPRVRQALEAAWINDPLSRRQPWRRVASGMLWALLRRHNDLVVRYSDGVVVCSSDDKEFIVRSSRINADRVLALAPGVPETYLIAAKPFSANRLRRLLYVGQFAAFKAPEIVSRVIAETLQKDAAATATWVCHRDHHSAAQGLLPSHLRPRVAFLSWMPRDQLRAVYDDHGILLLPSHFEGFSLTLLEAMARGLCVLCTRVGGAPDVVVEGENGFLFGPGDVDGLTQRAILLTRDESRAAAVSRNAIQTAIRFTWDRAARELTQFYGHLDTQ